MRKLEDKFCIHTEFIMTDSRTQASFGWQVIYLLFFFFMGCQPPGKKNTSFEQPVIAFDLNIRYLASEQNFQASAQFYSVQSNREKKPLHLLSPVTLNDKSFRKTSQNSKYSLSQEGKAFEPTLQFQFTDNESNLRDFSYSIETFSNFLLKDNQVSQKNGGQISTRLSADHFTDVFVLIKDQNNRAEMVNTNIVALDKAQILIDFESPKLKNLKTGPVQLFLVQRRTKKDTTTSIIGNTTIEYYSTALNGMLIP